MLSTMRKNTKIILWITVIFFVLLIFLVWGADLQFGGGHKPNVAGRVNGEDISVAEYQQELAQNRQKARSQKQDLEPTDELLLQEQSWKNVVDRKLLNQEARRRGLLARDSEVRQVLLNDPPPFITQDPHFQNKDGKFDFAAYRALLQDPTVPENDLVQLENEVRRYLPLQKLQNIIVSAAKVTDDELRRQYMDTHEKVKITYVLVDATRKSVDPQVSDGDLEAYFEKHRKDYRLSRRATLRYVSVPRLATAADTASIQNDLASMADEARKAEASKSEDKESLDYSDFETLAMSFSDAPSADQGGLSAGFLSPSEMSPAMRKAVAGLAKGQISAPFRDGDSFHIVQVVDEKSENDSRSVKIRDLAMRIAPSDSTVNAVRDMLEEVRAAALTSNLTAAAKARKLDVHTVSNVTAAGVVPGLSAIPAIAQFALHHSPGTVSRVLATNSAWYLVEVAEVQEAGVPPLDSIRDRVKNDLLQERRFQAARADADRLRGRIKMGADLEQAAAAESLQVSGPAECTRVSGIPGLGQDPEVIAAAFSLPVGQVSDPVRASRGWVVLRVDEHPDLDWAKFDDQKDNLRRSLLNRKQNEIYAAWLEDLRQKAKIDDYRR